MNRKKYILNQARSLCIDLYENILEFQKIEWIRNIGLSSSYPFPIPIKNQIEKYDLIYSPYKGLSENDTKNLSIKELAVVSLDAFWFASKLIKSQSELDNLKKIKNYLISLLNQDSLTLTHFKIIIFQLSFLCSSISQYDDLKWKTDLIYFKLPYVSLKSDDWFNLLKLTNSQENVARIFNHTNKFSLQWAYIVFTAKTGISPILKIDYLFRDIQPTWICEFKSPRNECYLPHAGFFRHPTMHLMHDWGHESFFKVALLKFYKDMRNEIISRNAQFEKNLASAAKYLDFMAVHERPFVFGSYLESSKNYKNPPEKSKNPLEKFVQSACFFNSIAESEKKFFSVFKGVFNEIALTLGLSDLDIEINYKVHQLRLNKFNVTLKIIRKHQQICDLFFEFVLLASSRAPGEQKIVIKNAYYNKQCDNKLKSIDLIQQKFFTCKNIYIKFKESYGDFHWLLTKSLEHININFYCDSKIFSEKLQNITRATILLANKVYKKDY